MHATFAMFGIKHDMDFVLKFLETRTLYLPIKDKKGKEFKVPIQGQLRPIMLFDYVFPEAEKDSVLTTLGFHKKPYPQYSSMRPIVAALRTGLRCKPIPKFKTDQMLTMPEEAYKHVSVIPIGVRYDKELTFPNGLTHEAL